MPSTGHLFQDVPGTPGVTPEPASITLLAIAAAGLLTGRRRQG